MEDQTNLDYCRWTPSRTSK